MRVLSITTDAFGQIGGIAQYNRDFLTAFANYSHCAELVVVPRMAPQTPGELPQKLHQLGNGVQSKWQFSLAIIRRVLSDAKFDLVICGHINLLPLAYFASRWCKAPLVLMVYGIDAWQPARSSLINSLVTKIDAVVSISNITLGKFLAWVKAGQAKAYVLPNAIDLQQFFPGPKEDKLIARYKLAGKKVLVTTGRLVDAERYKGHDEILDLLPELSQEIPNLVYLVIGDGTDRQRLEEKSRSLGVADKVIFSGYIPEEEKLAHYRLADAYVMPSRGEGFGFVFLEAMASGVPVVASRVDGGREAVRDGLLGVLVDPNDPADIKRGIHESLGRSKGVVPAGLEYFSYKNFERRVHQFLDDFAASKENR